MKPFLKIQTVDIKYLPQVWPMVQAYIEAATKHTDDYSADQIKVFLSTGAWILIVAVDELQQVHGAATISIENGPNHRTAMITTIGGKGIVRKDTFEQLHFMLKSFGVTRLQGFARDSLVRLYSQHGLVKKSNLVEIKI